MQIREVKKEDAGELENIAKTYLELLYGDQTKAVNEWLTGKGFKHVFVLTVNNRIAGLLSLKNDPRKSYLKVSTLLVLEGFKKQGYGKVLLDKAEDFAKEGHCSKILVTVSETVSDSLEFFKNAGFIEIDRKLGKYIKNVAEIILEKEV